MHPPNFQEKTKQQDIITIQHLTPDATRSNVSLHIWIMPNPVGRSLVFLCSIPELEWTSAHSVLSQGRATCRHYSMALHTHSLCYWSHLYQRWSVCVLYLNGSRFNLSFSSLELPLPYITGCQEWQWRHVCGVCLCVALCSCMHVYPCRSSELEQETNNVRASPGSLGVVQQNGAFPILLSFSLSFSLSLSLSYAVIENCACSLIYAFLLSYSTHTRAFSLYPTLAHSHMESSECRLCRAE